MSFTIALLLVCAGLCLLLGLSCYHLLTRVHLLERAVEGGLGPPTRRLTREEFDRAFAQSLARRSLAKQVGTGVLVIVGAEPDEVGAAARDVARTRSVTVIELTTETTTIEGLDAEDLGVTTTPFVFVVDDGSIRAARPLSSPEDLVSTLQNVRDQH